MKTLNMQKVMNRASTHGKASMARAEKAREEAKKRRELEEEDRAARMSKITEGTAPEEDSFPQVEDTKALVKDLGDRLTCFLRTFRKVAITEPDVTRATWNKLANEIQEFGDRVPNIQLQLDRNITDVSMYLSLAERLHVLKTRQKDVRKNDPRIKLQPWDKAVIEAQHLASAAFSQNEKEIGKAALQVARDINVTH